MNPIKFAQMMKYLTRAKNADPNLPKVTTADKIEIPPKKQTVEEMEAVNAFMRRNPRVEKAGGGMLVQPSADGSRPGYAKDTTTSYDKTIRPEEKYTGSAKPPKKKKWKGIFGKEKADEIFKDYVKFYTDAYNNKNMSQVSEATTYFRQVYGEDADLAIGLLRRNGYTDLKSAPYKLKQKLLVELIDDAQNKIQYTNKFDILDKVFTESAAKKVRKDGVSSLFKKGENRQVLNWFTEDLFNKVDGMDKIDDKISKALDYMVKNNVEIKDVKKATGSVFTQGTAAGTETKLSPIKKTIVSLVDNGKDGISRALLNKGLEKNAWYQSQTQNGKNLFDYVAREYGTEFIGEGFLDAYESGKSRFGRVTVKGSTQMPLPESLIFQFAARSADRNFKAGTYEDGPVKITDLKGNELDYGSLPVNERGQRIIDPSKHKFTYNGTLYGKNNLRKLGYQSGDFTEVYQIASDFKSYSDELVPNPKNPNGKKITFRQLMDMSGIDYFMAIGHDDSKGGVRTRPFNNFQIQNKFVNKSLDSAYRQVKNKDLRKRIANEIYGNLKGLRGQIYKDAWIKNNTKLLNDIILNRNIPPSLYRQAGENIIQSDVFQTFSTTKREEALRVANVKKGSPLYKKLMTFCPKSNGGLPGTCSIDEAMNGLVSESKQLKSGNMNEAQAKKTAQKIRAVTRVGTGATLTSLLGPYGLAGEVVIDGAFMANNMLDGGDTYKEALSKSLIKYAMPTADRKKLEEETDLNTMILGSDTSGLAADFVDALKKDEDLKQKYENYLKVNQEDMSSVADPYSLQSGPMFSIGEKNKAEREFIQALERAEPTYGKSIYEIAKFGSPEQQAFAAKQEVFDAQKMQNRMDYDRKILGPLKDLFDTGFYSPEQLKRLQKEADRESLEIGQIPDELKTQQIADFGGVANLAGGGIAGVSGGVNQGPQRTSMNPDSQGLQGLMKRVRNR